MKKLLSILLTVMLLFSVCPLGLFSITASAAYYEGYYYNINDNKAIITSVDKQEISGNVEIPAYLGGYPVTSIGDYAFRNCSGLTSITIPNSVTSIGGYAFSGCSSLKSITIPDSVTSIGINAFEDCIALEKVEISDLSAWCNIEFEYFDSNPLEYAKKLYLNGTLITALVIPDTVKEIKDYAFRNCSGLTSVTIPNSVTSIGNNSFQHCRSLTSITISNSVTSIGKCAFSCCKGLTSITIPNSVTSIGVSAFECCSGLTSITIPNSVTSICPYAFYGCNSLTSITIPDSVTSISDMTFDGCDSLTSVTIPDSVTSISDTAFDLVFEMIIYASNQSCAKEYATNNEIAFCNTDELINPALESKTAKSVTLVKNVGYQYSIDGINWQDGSTFSNLNPNTEYTFYQRIPVKPDNISNGLKVLTSELSATQVPLNPQLESVTTNSVTPDATDGDSTNTLPADQVKSEGGNTVIYIIITIVAVVIIAGGITAFIIIKKKKANS